MTFRCTVTNAGDTLGRFVGGINAEGWYPHRPIAAVSRQIPPGETVTWEIPGENIDLPDDELAQRVGDEEANIHYELICPNGTREESIRIVEE